MELSMGLLIKDVCKSYAGSPVINNLSMEVPERSIFGFLGPHGAGKTTTMRMILDIIRPDKGTITWNGRPVQTINRQFWGYLPEERGLYPKLTVEGQLLFLAQLYGLPRRKTRQRIEQWLAYFQISPCRHTQIRQLSKGNQQKVQFLAAILHDPAVLIMDEPFSGLDLVNAEMLKEAFLQIHRQGKTIIFSTHQMQQVEELCQQIVIINKGRVAIAGDVQQVKRASLCKIVRLTQENDHQIQWLDTISGVQVIKRCQEYIEVSLQAHIHPDDILKEALRRGGQVTRFELAEPSLYDIFLEKMGSAALPDPS